MRCGLKLERIFIFLAFLFYVRANCLVAEVEEHHHGEHAEASNIIVPMPKIRLPNFGRFKKQFVSVCEVIGEDLRREKLYEMLLSLSARNEECSSCRPLISTFAAACKLPVQRKKPKKKEADPEHSDVEKSMEEVDAEVVPTPTPHKKTKQREPHAAVIALLSELFAEIRDSGEDLSELVKAIDRLSVALSTHPSFTPGEREYFSIMAVYISAPFAEVLREDSDRTDNGRSAEPSKGNIDDLFQ